MTTNKEFVVERGVKNYSVNITSSPIEDTDMQIFVMVDDKEIEAELRQGISVTFDEITKEDAGNHSVEVTIGCYKDSNQRRFYGNFTLNVICK